MKYQNKQFTFSPTDLSAFINCKALTFYNKEAALGNRNRPVYASRVTNLLIERGNAFEKTYLEKLVSQGKSIMTIQPEIPEAYEDTVKGMKAGYDIIYQARLKMDNWKGWGDFLIKVDGVSELGNWSYEVADTKLATQTKAATILQITLYSEMIKTIQGVMPEFMHVITPDGENKYRVTDYLFYVQFVKNRFLLAMESEVEVYPDVAAHCDICNWWEECNRRRRLDDHLSFIAGISKQHIKEVRTRDVNTLVAMAELPLPISFTPSRGSKETYAKVREQARVQRQSREEKRPVHEMLPRAAGMGLFRLPEPSAWDIYLDLEGDPMVEPAGREYIIGWYYQGEYYIKWAETAEKEKEAFESFIDFALAVQKAHPESHIYHYGSYEVSAFKRLMCRYSTREDEMDNFLRSGKFIDLLNVVKQSMRAGVERYSLKDLEKYHGFVREMDLRTMSPIKADYEFLMQTNMLQEVTDDMREVIRMYNQDDCVSTKHLHKWLEREREQLVSTGEVIERPEIKTGEATENITQHQERIKLLFDKLLRDLPLEFSDRDEIQQAKYILAHMLDWYRREEKIFWWEFFRLFELSEDELLDEKQALSGLAFTGETEPIARSVIQTYTFLPQDCDIRKGNKLRYRNQKTAGEVVSIDYKKNIIRLKKGQTSVDRHESSLYFLEYIPQKEKEEAIIRIAEWVIENSINSDVAFRCGRNLLLKSNPQTKKSFVNNDNSIFTASAWAFDLGHSVLPIQGPPGTGKSFTAAKMILELVKKKKKIGVTALSHKVITNLLQKIQEESGKEGMEIKMLQKIEDTSQWETSNNNNYVEDSIKNFQVIAGTTFLWCREGMNQKVDYLFVDEAGQLSLIDTVAVSHATKNLILLGDPQQLKQPQQGIHPEGTEVSALEHILNGNKTISQTQGIFLSETYRMHPSICAFDSELFYEGKLNAVMGLENQRLEGNTRFAGSGLFLESVEHHSNTNRSVEEIEVIEAIVKDLCKGDVYWNDKDNKRKVLTKNDIRIIAPYNAQVHELADRMPDVAIGTVDKFQGQEAPVVIFSMTTSSPQDAPRGMDFLYSPNRFNVAVSRARAVFLMVASPALLEAECKSPDQIKLVNAFCRYWEVAKNNF